MSAYLEQDSELFVNYVSAQAIPAERDFFAFRDNNGSPGLFSLGSDGTLNLFRQKDGKLQNVSYNQLCGLNSPVLAFNAVQCSDNSVCLVFAISTASGCQLITLPMIMIASIDNPSMSKAAMSATDLPAITHIILSDFCDSNNLPLSIVAFQPFGRITQKDCALVTSEVENGTLVSKLSTTWHLPVDVEDILDLALGRTTIGDGVFVLYRVAGQLNLVFSTYDGSNFNVLVHCSPDATAISTFCPANDNSHLIVGGTELAHFTQAEYLRKLEPFAILTSFMLTAGIKDLRTAVSDRGFSVWFVTINNATGYVNAAADDAGEVAVIPLLADGKATRISPILQHTGQGTEAAVVNGLISVDAAGNLTSLQQAEANGVWDAYPLMAYASTNNYEVPSYTTCLRVMRGSNVPEPNATFKLVTDGRVSAIINGWDTYLEPGDEGQTISCDASGEVTLIVAVADVSSHVFTLTNFLDAQGKDINGLEDVVVDPAAKTMNALSRITDANSLRSLKTRSGVPVFSTDGMSEKDVQEMAGYIGKIADHGKAMSMKASRTRQGLKSARNLDSPLDTASELWNWVVERVDAAETWILTETGDALEFAIHLAEGAYKFLLDSAKAVGKALTWVFEKLKADFSKVIDCFAFVFDWNDILTLKSSLSTTLTAGLQWSADRVDDASKATDQFLVDQKSKITGDASGLGKQASDLSMPAQAVDTQSSVGFKFSGYHLVHGGALDALLPAIDPSDMNLLQNAAGNMLSAFTAVEDDIKAMIRSVQTALQNMDKSISAGDLAVLVLRGLAVTLVDVARGIASTVLGVVKDLIAWIIANGNTPVQVPIFSALYRQISGGHELTMFDAISLIIAIPAQIIGKLVTGEALPDVTSFMSKDNFGAYVGGTLSNDQAVALNNMFVFGSVGAETVGFIVQAFAFLSGDNVAVRDTRSVNATPPTKIKALSWMGLITGTSNVVLGVPVGVKDDGKVIDWARWIIAASQLAAGGTFMALDVMGKGPSESSKQALAISQAFGQTIGAALYFARRTQSSQDFPTRRDAVVSVHWTNSISKAGALLFRDSEPVIAAGCEAVYGVSAFGQLAVQLWSIEAAFARGYLWQAHLVDTTG